MTKFNQPPVTISVLALSEKVGKTTTAYFIAANLLKLNHNVTIQRVDQDDSVILSNNPDQQQFNLLDCTATLDTQQDQTAIQHSQLFVIPVFLTAYSINEIEQTIAKISEFKQQIANASIFILPRKIESQGSDTAKNLYGLLRNNYKNDSRIVLLPTIPWVTNLKVSPNQLSAADSSTSNEQLSKAYAPVVDQLHLD
ncbi:hypothetical protein FC26_GL002302 [Paucilactobacillus vaccinostercus DSM 20634]|uniref:CobQ/CobB/MinD/ParA nucleotide binding domain-containing protein n=1 Tax=Paucilactobacillus vaccinostercus DSM 20634 TaxID=1423813 RepID=A0A0R2AEH1_9LACO|nr:hypothetical protein [Paucilactobacillus vaccinostercus]KRM61084.1 hypothetical protein FC26_GL002302 [Paucilactobacillus vaccinostercus DSM 20634]